MAGGHFGFEQEFATGGGGPELGDPFRRLHIEHPGVVDAGQGENIGVGFCLNVFVGGVAGHVVVDVFVGQGVAPFFPFGDGERQLGHEHGGERVDEGNVRFDGFEPVAAQVCDGTHEEAAGGATQGHEGVPGGEVVVEQVVGNSNEVGEGVAFVQHFAVVVPVAAELTATPDVGECEDHAPVHEREAGNRESRVEGDFVGTVAVENGGLGVGKVHVAAVHQGDGNVDPIACGDPHAAGHIVVRVIATQDFLFLK